MVQFQIKPNFEMLTLPFMSVTYVIFYNYCLNAENTYNHQNQYEIVTFEEVSVVVEIQK